MSEFDSSDAPVWRHRKSINDKLLRHGHTAAEIKVVSAELSILLAGRIERRLRRSSDTAKYCFEEYPRTCSAPLLLLAPLARNTIVLLYDLRRELGSFAFPFSPPPYPASSSFFVSHLFDSPSSWFLRLRLHFVYHHLTHLGSFEVWQFRSYDFFFFYPVNNVDFGMMSSRLWTRTDNLPISRRNSRAWLSLSKKYSASGEFYILLQTILFANS